MPSDSSICDPDVALWLSGFRAAGRRLATLKHYQWCTEQYLTWWSGAAITATRSDAVAYSAYLTERYRPASAASILRSVRAMCSWLEREEIVEENPFRRLVVEVPEVFGEVTLTIESPADRMCFGWAGARGTDPRSGPRGMRRSRERLGRA